MLRPFPALPLGETARDELISRGQVERRARERILPGSDRWRYGDTQLGQLRPDCLAGVRDDGRLAWREGDQTFPAGLVLADYALEDRAVGLPLRDRRHRRVQVPAHVEVVGLVVGQRIPAHVGAVRGLEVRRDHQVCDDRVVDALRDRRAVTVRDLEEVVVAGDGRPVLVAHHPVADLELALVNQLALVVPDGPFPLALAQVVALLDGRPLGVGARAAGR